MASGKRLGTPFSNHLDVKVSTRHMPATSHCKILLLGDHCETLSCRGFFGYQGLCESLFFFEHDFLSVRRPLSVVLIASPQSTAACTTSIQPSCPSHLGSLRKVHQSCERVFMPVFMPVRCLLFPCQAILIIYLQSTAAGATSIQPLCPPYPCRFAQHTAGAPPLIPLSSSTHNLLAQYYCICDFYMAISSFMSGLLHARYANYHVLLSGITSADP
jgi:hypothetical protein